MLLACKKLTQGSSLLAWCGVGGAGPGSLGITVSSSFCSCWSTLGPSAACLYPKGLKVDRSGSELGSFYSCDFLMTSTSNLGIKSRGWSLFSSGWPPVLNFCHLLCRPLWVWWLSLRGVCTRGGVSSLGGCLGGNASRSELLTDTIGNPWVPQVARLPHALVGQFCDALHILSRTL